MAIIFQDFFEEEVETLLEQHTPDIGTGWSIIYDTFTTAVVMVKPVGVTGVPYVAAPNTSNNGMGRVFAIQPAPAAADVALETDVFETDWSRANSYNRGLFARDTGGHTHYAVSILPNGHSQPSIRLFKTVAGSSDVIGSYDAELQNGDVIRFECYDAAKRVLLNGVEVISVADNAISGAGDAGLFWGNWNGQNGDGHPDRRGEFGAFTAESVAAGPVYVDLDAQAQGSTIVSAALSTSAQVDLAVSIAGQADVTATLAALRDLLAGAAGQSDVTAATASLLIRLSAAPIGTTAITASLDTQGHVDLAASTSGSTDVASALAVDATLNATVAGAALVEADLLVTTFQDLAAAAEGAALMQAALSVLTVGAVADVQTWAGLLTDIEVSEHQPADIRTIGRPLTVAVTTSESVR